MPLYTTILKWLDFPFATAAVAMSMLRLQKRLASTVLRCGKNKAWLDLLEVQGTLKSLLQHHTSKATILQHSAFFTVQLSHAYMTTDWKNHNLD